MSVAVAVNVTLLPTLVGVADAELPSDGPAEMVGAVLRSSQPVTPDTAREFAPACQSAPPVVAESCKDK